MLKKTTEEQSVLFLRLVGSTDGDCKQEVLESFDDEMLVMCQLGRQMDLLLNYLRKERVHIPLKAVLTPVNQEWDSVRLYHEIKSEHEQMTGQPLKK